VQTLLKTRSPALTAPRIVSGPTLLTGICFCAACGMAMTLRTGKAGRYRYMFDESPAGRDRPHGPHRTYGQARHARCRSHRAAASGASPSRGNLSSVLDRREERAERRATHIAELRKRAAEADAKLKRLYDAIENGVADLADSMLKDRIAELNGGYRRDHLRALAQRVEVDAKEVRIMGAKSVLLRSRGSLKVRPNICPPGPG
jgi:site-specific DNA recombinase